MCTGIFFLLAHIIVVISNKIGRVGNTDENDTFYLSKLMREVTSNRSLNLKYEL